MPLPRWADAHPTNPKTGSLPSQIAQKRRNPGALVVGTPVGQPASVVRDGLYLPCYFIRKFRVKPVFEKFSALYFEELSGIILENFRPHSGARSRRICKISLGKFGDGFHFGNLYVRFVEDCAQALRAVRKKVLSSLLPAPHGVGYRECRPWRAWVLCSADILHSHPLANSAKVWARTAWNR